MIKSIRKIEFSIGGFTQGNITYRVDETGVTRFEDAGYLMSMPPEMTVANPINQKQQKELIDLLNNLNFLSWEKNYWEDVCDGEQWELMVTYNGNLRKKVTKSKDFLLGSGYDFRLFNSYQNHLGKTYYGVYNYGIRYSFQQKQRKLLI